FGVTYFVPAATSRLAASSVLVLGLGAPQSFTPDRIPELGAALVEAMATFGLRDAATIVHAAGSIGVDANRAVCWFLSGVLTGLQTIPGASCFRELSIYEADAAKVPDVRRGIMAAAAAPGIHVYVEEAAEPHPAERDLPDRSDARPDDLRIYVTQAGANVKVAVVGHDAYDAARQHPWPSKVVKGLNGRIEESILNEPSADKRRQALCGIGSDLYNAFFEWTQFDLEKQILAAKDDYLVLRLDELTVDLPWELLCLDGEFLSRTHVFSRQLEIEGAPGRQGAIVQPHPRLRVLVIGNPTGDLDGAQREAEALVEMLDAHPSAEVTPLIGNVTYEDVYREIDTQPAFDVIHYAGHAQFDPLREEASGFELAGDQMPTLTAAELSTWTRLPGLFVANACNSAQTGDDLPPNPFEGARETLNLVSGLLARNVRGFVGSAWKVDDEAATTFAKAFYEALLPDPNGGPPPAPIGEAVRRARLAIVREHGESEPAWAGYALYGAPWKAAFDFAR
ncbi:MAG: CHAT domain-containing protein, partial [Actinomycetota bacterium]|nr:CHAT domain-containing protein [Actinomycetota bacterium]